MVNDKPFKAALRLELAAAGENHTQLRRLARALIQRAATGDVSALKEVADRTDGKVPQAIVGDSEYDPVNVRGIAWLSGIDEPGAPAVIEHQANDLQLTAEEVSAPVETVSTFKLKPFRRRNRNAYMAAYMARRRAAAKLNGKG